ncbi:hypothetical protein P9139_08790 [Curtobacterium flaccumfaciens]|nr:hypothetical protein P9139_08790 [Curtobacterium flaccumfaciens]
MDALAQAGADLASDAGHPATAAVLDQVRATIEAAMADPRAGAAVRSGLLLRPLESAGFDDVDLDGTLADPDAVPDAWSGTAAQPIPIEEGSRARKASRASRPAEPRLQTGRTPKRTRQPSPAPEAGATDGRTRKRSRESCRSRSSTPPPNAVPHARRKRRRARRAARPTRRSTPRRTTSGAPRNVARRSNATSPPPSRTSNGSNAPVTTRKPRATVLATPSPQHGRPAAAERDR